uniref:Glutamate synthase [NADPH] small chain n=2 Tax=Anthurium amnicola TaxID=1678845 RepID=A0A1D1XCH6_9ARAE
MQDKIHANGSDINSKVAALKEYLCNLNSLEIKLKAYKDELLQTRIKNSLIWAEKETSMDCIEAFIPGAAERMSFAALQPVSGSTQLELLALRRRKLWAMTSRDTLERLRNGLELVEHNIALVAAKLAIQSVEM